MLHVSLTVGICLNIYRTFALNSAAAVSIALFFLGTAFFPEEPLLPLPTRNGSQES